MASNKEKQIAEALKLVEKGQYEKAVKIYLKVVAEDDKDVRIWLKIGDLYAKLGRNHEAAETYERVAQYYSDQGFYTKAVAVYKQILKLEPRLVAVNERLAELYTQMGIIPDAIEQFAALAAFHSREGNVRGSLTALKQIVELDPTNVASRVKLAEMYSKEQMTREAIDEFARAAEFLHEQARYDDYLKVGERLLFHQPDNRAVSKELARIYIQKGDARRALPRLQVSFKADPRDVETLTLLAQAFDALGQLPKTVSVLKELARIHADNGHHTDSEETWRKVQRLVPDDPDTAAALNGKPAMAAGPGPRLADQLTFSGATGTGPHPVLPGAGPLRMTPSPMPVVPSEAGNDSGAPARPTPGLAASLASTGAYPVIERQDPPRVGDRADSRGVRGPEAPRLGDRAAPAHPRNAGAAPSPASRPSVRDSSATPSHVPAVAGARSFAAPPIQAPVPSATSEEASITRILAETEVYAKYSLFEKAIEHVRSVFELAPNSVPAREKLKTLLLQLGRTDEAVAELERLATQTAGQPAAEGYRREILTLDPSRERSASASASPGRAAPVAGPPPSVDDDEEVEVDMADLEEVSAESDELGLDDVSFVDTPPEQGPPAPTVTDELGDDEIPLVVDGGDARAAAATDRSGFEDRFGADLAAADAVEDRFGADLDDEDEPPLLEDREAAATPTATAALGSRATPVDDEVEPTTFGAPQFGLESASKMRPPTSAAEVEDFDFSSFDDPSQVQTATHAAAPPAAQAVSRSVVETTVPVTEPRPDAAFVGLVRVAEVADEASFADVIEDPDEPTGHHAAVEPLPSEHAGLSDDLDEADFYLQQGMHEEARELLEGLLASHPGHPLLESKLQELAASAPPPITTSASAAADDDAALDSAFNSFPPDDAAAAPEPTLVSSGLAAMGAGTPGVRGRKNVVEAGVEDDDFESHYDLGIAYREMGFLDDAIVEFQSAMRDPARQLQCRLMLGLCYILKGQNLEAINHFKLGLYSDHIEEHEQMALYYEIGKVYEKIGDKAEALYYFDKIAKRGTQAAWADMYRDVEHRIRSLRPRSEGGFATGEEFEDEFRREPVGAVNRK